MQTLPPDVLARIVQLCVPLTETYIGQGNVASLLNVELGHNDQGLSGLRLVCRSFRDAVNDVPLLLIASSKAQVRWLKRAPFSSWRLEAVHLKFTGSLAQEHGELESQLMLEAAAALPQRLAGRVVTASVYNEMFMPIHRDLSRAVNDKLVNLRHICMAGGIPPSKLLPTGLERVDLLYRMESDGYMESLLEWPQFLTVLHTLQLEGRYILLLQPLIQSASLRVLSLGSGLVLTLDNGWGQALLESGLASVSIRFASVWDKAVMCSSTRSLKSIHEALYDSLVRNGEHFSTTVVWDPISRNSIQRRGTLVIQRRSAEDALRQRIAACKGGCLPLDDDLSAQVVLRGGLQALVRETGLPVELRLGWLMELELQSRDPALRFRARWEDAIYSLGIPVASVQWHEGLDVWPMLPNCKWAADQVAAMHRLSVPATAASAFADFAQKYCNLRMVSMAGHPLVRLLPLSCVDVSLSWTGLGSMGETHGLQKYRSITRLTLNRFRVTELPPNLTDLHLTACEVEQAQLPAGCQLRTLQLHGCDHGPSGPTFAHQSSRAPIDLLGWLEATQVQYSVHVSDACLTLGRLSMERFAKQLSEVDARVISIAACTLHRADGRLSMHSVADVGVYMQKCFGRRVLVRPMASKNSCAIEKI